jgi:hypothetical protein
VALLFETGLVANHCPHSGLLIPPLTSVFCSYAETANNAMGKCTVNLTPSAQFEFRCLISDRQALTVIRRGDSVAW